MQVKEWLIIIGLVLISNLITLFVAIANVPYIGDVQFSRNDLGCSGCIDGRTYSESEDGERVFRNIIRIVPDEFCSTEYSKINGSIERVYHSCFNPYIHQPLVEVSGNSSHK